MEQRIVGAVDLGDTLDCLTPAMVAALSGVSIVDIAASCANYFALRKRTPDGRH